MQNLPGQRTHIQQLLRINACGRAEHQVSYVVAGRIARPQTGIQQAGNQPVVVGADAANLQIAAIGRLDHATCEPLGGTCHDQRLIR